MQQINKALYMRAFTAEVISWYLSLNFTLLGLIVWNILILSFGILGVIYSILSNDRFRIEMQSNTLFRKRVGYFFWIEIVITFFGWLFWPLMIFKFFTFLWVLIEVSSIKLHVFESDD